MKFIQIIPAVTGLHIKLYYFMNALKNFSVYGKCMEDLLKDKTAYDINWIII